MAASDVGTGMIVRQMLDHRKHRRSDKRRTHQEPPAPVTRRPFIAMTDDVFHRTAQHAPLPVIDHNYRCGVPAADAQPGPRASGPIASQPILALDQP